MGRGVKGEGVNGEVEGHTWVVESQGREAPGSRFYLKPYSQFSQLSCSILRGRPGRGSASEAPGSTFYYKPYGVSCSILTGRPGRGNAGTAGPNGPDGNQGDASLWPRGGPNGAKTRQAPQTTPTAGGRQSVGGAQRDPSNRQRRISMAPINQKNRPIKLIG